MHTFHFSLTSPGIKELDTERALKACFDSVGLDMAGLFPLVLYSGCYLWLLLTSKSLRKSLLRRYISFFIHFSKILSIFAS